MTLWLVQKLLTIHEGLCQFFVGCMFFENLAWQLILICRLAALKLPAIDVSSFKYNKAKSCWVLIYLDNPEARQGRPVDN